MPAFEGLTLDCEMVPANGSSRDRQGPHRCTLAAHEDQKQTFVNSVEADNPQAFQHDHAFCLLGKIKKYHIYYLQMIDVSTYGIIDSSMSHTTLTPYHASYPLHYSHNQK